MRLGYQPRRVGLRTTWLDPNGPCLVAVILRPQFLPVLQDPRSKNQALPLPSLFGFAHVIVTSFHGISGWDYPPVVNGIARPFADSPEKSDAESARKNSAQSDQSNTLILINL